MVTDISYRVRKITSVKSLLKQKRPLRLIDIILTSNHLKNAWLSKSQMELFLDKGNRYCVSLAKNNLQEGNTEPKEICSYEVTSTATIKEPLQSYL